MSAVWTRLRSDVRRRWRAWIGLALLVGFAGGAAMALAQAARRNQHAYERFSEHNAAADVIMTGRGGFGLVGGVDIATVARTGYVASSAPAFVGLPFSGRTDTGRSVDTVDLLPVAARDGRLGNTVERWKMLAGRRARPSQLGEATASFLLAERLGLRVGSRLELRFYRADRFLATAVKILEGLAPRIEGRHRNEAAPDFADGPVVKFTIVGIEASPAEFPPLLTDLAPILHLTPAFAHRYENRIVGSPLAYVRLRPGRDLASFQLAVERLAAGQPVSFVTTRVNQSAKVQRAIRAEALALATVAGLVALAGAVAIGQTLTRQALAESSQFPTLRALGMRERQLRATTFARVLAIGAAGAVIACLVAVFGAQHLLLPLARKAELDPGPHVDLPVLVVGSAAVMLLASVVAWWSSRLATQQGGKSEQHSDRARTRRRRVRSEAAPIGTFPLTPTLGIRYALHRAARAMPAWATMIATGLTFALLAGAVTFTANLHRVLDDAHRYGWNWDVKVGAPGLPDYGSFALATLRRDPDVTALSAGTDTQIDLGKERIDVFAVDRVLGDALPTMLAGYVPELPGEIALGGRSMRDLDAHIGDFVTARIGTRTARLRVVGQTVLPEFGDAGQLGTGSLMTLEGLDALLPHAAVNSFLVRFGNARDGRAEGELLARAFAPIPSRFQARPQDLIELARGGGLLVALVVLLSALALAVLLHALVTSVRAREHDFGVLRALGFTSHHLRSVVLWQSLTLVAGSFALGMPLGSLLGRRAWMAFAHQLGVAPDAMFLPGRFVAVMGAGALGLALLAAIVPAAIAVRTRPTSVLHSE